MNCDQTDSVLHCYFDNELDALSATAFERHLEHCSQCEEQLAALKKLRSRIGGAQLYRTTPTALRKKLVADLRSPGPLFVMPPQIFWASLALAASLLLVTYAGWRALSVRGLGNSETMLAAEVIDAHLRSLQPGHLVDVLSSDQHTVKPWFSGKLDFSPPVRDFADRGFPLDGGRLDVIDGRATAALIYRRRKHLISVFIWPTNEPNRSPRAGSRQGYNWVDWSQGGMELWMVSDVASSDLEQLRRDFVQ
jgi:anti-sigma factor RsiW